MALSSCDAEYVGIVESAKVCFKVEKLLQFLRNTAEEFIFRVINDNESALTILRGHQRYQSKTIHIQRRYHYLKQYVEEGKVKLEHRKSEELEADCMTKALGKLKFKKLRNKIMLQ